jgi:hypothetical protein
MTYQDPRLPDPGLERNPPRYRDLDTDADRSRGDARQSTYRTPDGSRSAVYHASSHRPECPGGENCASNSCRTPDRQLIVIMNGVFSAV